MCHKFWNGEEFDLLIVLLPQSQIKPMEHCGIQFSQNVHQQKLMVSVDRARPVNLSDNHVYMCLSTIISVLCVERKTCKKQQ